MRQYNKGFTLVELIVVIAIIAILTSVLIPSFASYVDRSRFSNDVQKAGSMTKIMQAHDVDKDESYDAYDVKLIIESYQDQEVDFTPTASNTGFFYLASSNRVVAMKYEDVDESLESLRLVEHRLLNDTPIEDESEFSSPAEFFGSGTHLLTTERSAIAVAVDFIYALAKSGSALSSSYDLGIEKIEQYQSGTIFGKLIALFGFGLNEELEEKLERFIDFYDPVQTLYVNDVSWSTKAEVGANVKSIVFAQGITNIPTFDKDFVENTISFETVSLPSTVRSIDSNAFSNKFQIGNLHISSSYEIKAEQDAFTGVTTVMRTVSVFDKDDPNYEIVSEDPSNPLITYDPYTILDTFTFDLTRLIAYLQQQEIEVVAYNVEIDLFEMEESIVYVYTINGYLGYVIPVEEIQE